MKCNCIEEVDKKLASENLKLACVGLASQDGVLDTIITLETEWVNRNSAPRGRKNTPSLMFASFCPFCGKSIRSKNAGN